MDENQKIAEPDLAPRFLSILTVPLHQTHASTQMPQVATVFQNYETNFFLSYPLTFIYLSTPVFSAFTSFLWTSARQWKSLVKHPTMWKPLPLSMSFQNPSFYENICPCLVKKLSLRAHDNAWQPESMRVDLTHKQTPNTHTHTHANIERWLSDSSKDTNSLYRRINL